MSEMTLPPTVVAGVVLSVLGIILILIYIKNAVFRIIEFGVLYWLFTAGWPHVVALARAWKVWDFVAQAAAVVYDFVVSAANSANAAGGSPAEL